MKKFNLGIFASHGGTNMQSIIDACKNGDLKADISVVISNNSKSKALLRAKNEGIKNYHLSSYKYNNDNALDEVILNTLVENDVDIIVLAGYMKKLGQNVLTEFKGRILNIHPSLLPKYGGKGMYGMNVHNEVIKAGEKKTGITVHLVDEEYDTGKIINQCEIDVLESDNTESLARRVLSRENRFYVETLVKIVKGEIELDGLVKNIT